VVLPVLFPMVSTKATGLVRPVKSITMTLQEA
jgi:hypothetical protein